MSLHPSPILMLAAFLFMSACQKNEHIADAYGNFEAVEIIVSAEANGKLVYFPLEEGQAVAAGALTAVVDTMQLHLQRERLKASILSLGDKTQSISEQLAVYEERKANLIRERDRFVLLLRDKAATQKQVDDLNGEIEVVDKQMIALRSQISAQNRGILSETAPLKKQIEQLDDQILKSKIVSPVSGTVLTKYAEAGEVATFGKALFKIADLSTLTLRAYLSGNQLPTVQLNQPVKVLTDNGQGGYNETAGTITWISDKAEFTPKTVQTKDERANMVYAVKIRVKNDGKLKIGMYGEVVLSDEI